jgi:hypothetical protein
MRHEEIVLALNNLAVFLLGAMFGAVLASIHWLEGSTLVVQVKAPRPSATPRTQNDKRMPLLEWVRRLWTRQPHFVIGGDRPYLLRWWLIPRNPVVNVFLHKFLRDDDDRALHDHPWPSVSLMLAGGLIEHTTKGARVIGPGRVVFRVATFRHRVELVDGRPAWTLFITGPKLREWGFWCPKGFVHWERFVAPTDQGQIGRGCDQ